MLQQTTVAAVIPYYERWLRQFPDVLALGRAPLSRVLKAWEGLGYYERARRLHRAARIVGEELGGSLPGTEAGLGRLPGFGPYITAAVLSFAYGQPVAVLDANVRRVLMRLKGVREGSPGAAPRELRRTLDELLDRSDSAAFNQAMMEFGELVCRPRQPLCPRCPVRRFCRARRAGEEKAIPAPKPRAAARIETVVAIIRRNGRYLIQKRPPSGLMAGLWEFPGGKREKGESLETALRREIKEELGAAVKEARQLTRVRHSYTRFQVTLHAFATVLAHVPSLDRRTHRWVTRDGLKRYAFPAGSAKIIKYLERMEEDHRHPSRV